MLLNKTAVSIITIIIIVLGIVLPLILLTHEIYKARKAREPMQWPSIAAYIGFIIISLFLSIALPVASNIFRSVGQRAQETAVTEMSRIAFAQSKFMQREGRYAYSFAELDWRPQSGVYSFYMGDDSFLSSQQSVIAKTLPQEYSAFATDTIYQVVAVSNIDKDETPDIWIMRDGNKPKHEIDDLDR
jgi:hypothetical protein